MQNSEAWGTQQIRSISKKAKEAERNIVVKLLKDVPRFGRAGTIYEMGGRFAEARHVFAAKPLLQCQACAQKPQTAALANTAKAPMCPSTPR